jgi:hypothetical protein
MKSQLATYLGRAWGSDRSRIAVLVALGVVLRLPTLGSSFSGDEAFSLLRDSNTILLDTDDRYRPLFFSLLYLWKKLGFSGEVGLRLLPLGFGVLQIPLAYWVGFRSGGRQLAFVVSLLVAANPMLAEFSQELRMYSMLPFFGLLQTGLLLEWVHRARQGRSTTVWWIASIPVAVAGTYTHLHYWLHLVGLSLTAFRFRQNLAASRVPLVVGAVLLAYLPNVPHVLEFADTDANNEDLQADDAKGALPKLLVAFSVGFNYFRVPEQDAARVVKFDLLTSNLDLLLLLSVPLALLAYGFFRAHRRDLSDPRLLLGHELFTVPLLLGLLASVPLGWKFIHPKYLVGTAPFFLLLCATAACELNRERQRFALAVTTFAVWWVSFVHYWNPRDYGRREDWHAATELFRKEQARGTVLLLIGTFYEQSYPLFEHYAPDLRPRIVPTQLMKSDEEVELRMRRELGAARRFCYLRWDTLQNMEDPSDRMLRASRRLGHQESVTRLNPRLVSHCWNTAT